MNMNFIRIVGMLEYAKNNIDSAKALIDDTRVTKYDSETGVSVLDCESDFAKDILHVISKLSDCEKDLDNILKKYS